jgi:carbon storage regulator
MLLLSRKISESIIINDNIVVKILGVKGNQIRLGVSAPREIAVHREEVFNRIKKEKSVAEDKK